MSARVSSPPLAVADPPSDEAAGASARHHRAWRRVFWPVALLGRGVRLGYTRVRERWPLLWRLAALIAPYKGRFILGQGAGVLYAVLNNSLLPLATMWVASIAFPGGGSVPSPKSLLFGGGGSGGATAANNGGGPTLGGTQVLLTCLSIPAVMLLRSLFNYLNVYCNAWISLKVLVELRHKLFIHLTRQGLDFFNESRSGMLINRVATETGFAAQALTLVGTDIIKNPVAVLAGLGYLLVLDWRFTLLALGLFPACILPVAAFGRRIRKNGNREEREAGLLTVILQETFAGIRVIKSFAREDHQVRLFEQSGRSQFNAAMRIRRGQEIASSLVEVAGAAGAALALFYVYAAGLGVGKFVGLVFGIFSLYEPIKQLSRMHVQMERCQVGTESIFALLEHAPSVADRPGARPLPGRARGEIRLENVTFRYAPHAPPALDGVSLQLDAGKYYALVGASGAGKSTLFSLLQRFYDPTEGCLRLDGHDLRDLTQAGLRAQVGVVTQDTFLFHESVADNVRYGRLEATDEEVRAAARLAHAEGFIAAMPEGYATVVGDKGCRLSGGQQQRLAIARAVLKDAPVLLLDEATSALDSESERAIQEALETLAAGRTVIAIAHRLSTILKADEIIVLEAGRVVEQGTHAALVAREGGVYRRLYDLQFGAAA